MRKLALILPLVAQMSALPAWADPSVIEGVSARKSGNGWSFAVTLRHPDTGWDHYADGWRVLAPDGTELGMRVLHHPHVDEQPFTRSLSGVVVPDGVTEVQIQARCSVDGWDAETVTVSLE